MKGTVVIAGALAQRPGQGGHTWVFLQYLLGFRRLGWDVLFLDHVDPAMCRDTKGHPCAVENSTAWRYLRHVMGAFGLGEAFALFDGASGQWLNLRLPEVLERTRRAAFLLNVMGYLRDEIVLAAAPRRVFLDIDPGFGQIWRETRLHDSFAGHDAFVTIGQNIGRPGCTVPTCGLSWIPTAPPVLLSEWPTAMPGAGTGFTSVATWRGDYGPVSFNGKTYGLRVHEFRKIADLPRRSGQQFRLALDIHPNEERDLAMLQDNGWQIEDPGHEACDPWAYRSYIGSSLAEFAVAKQIYVETGGGWFSDRSACYLSSGKPVIAQDTGLADIFPSGRGLLTFRSFDEALAAVEEVASDPAGHGRAARELACEFFDSDRVLTQLLARLAAA